MSSGGSWTSKSASSWSRRNASHGSVSAAPVIRQRSSPSGSIVEGRVPHPAGDVGRRGLDRRHHLVGRRLGERLALDERDGVEAVGKLMARTA